MAAPRPQAPGLAAPALDRSRGSSGRLNERHSVELGLDLLRPDTILESTASFPSFVKAFKLLLTFDNVSIDTDRRELRRDGRLCLVEPQVFDLLEFLIKNRNRSVSRVDLLEAIWNGRIVSAATLTHRINAARAAIGDNGYDQRLIRTVAQQGVRFIGAIKEQRTTAPPTLTKPHRPSIAVLPFTNAGEDPEQDYFADGMVEEIITGLSRVKWLFVIARNSTFAYRGRTIGAMQAGKRWFQHANCGRRIMFRHTREKWQCSQHEIIGA
jgi:DNA-binding winged helix-turn-helix (wHTH) protein